MPSLKRFVFLIAMALLCAWMLRTFLYVSTVVESESMEPTLFRGAHYFVNRWVYRFEDPQRGDLISFTSPVDGKTMYTKRLIALPGDQVELREKKVFLNGQPLEEPYAIYKRAAQRLIGDSIGPLTVPTNAYFVLGDNRDFSYDSTQWKGHDQEHMYFLPRKNIIGRVAKP